METLLAASAAGQQALPTASSAVLSIEAPPREVVLFEDRAQVTRRGLVELPAGRVRVRVEGVAPVLADRTLAIAASSPAAPVEVCDARVEREPRLAPGTPPADLAALAGRVEAAAQHVARLQGRLEALKTESGLLDLALRQTLSEIVVDAAWDRVEPEAWGERLHRVEGGQAATGDSAHATELELQTAQEELADLRARYVAARRPDETLHATVIIDLLLEQAAACTIEVRYCVPGACWRPHYRAWLQEPDGPQARLRLQSQGCVWQNTGEAWSDVRVQLSTQRPSLGADPPLLSDDLLVSERRDERTVVRGRDQVIAATSAREGPATARELPGIDDGGEPLGVWSEAPATIASDGRPHFVPIGTIETAATVDRVLIAERVPAVFRRCSFAHAEPHPLLAGPVELLLGGGRVGRGRMGFAAAGERIELGFGPDPTLRAQRDEEAVRHKPGALSRWQRVEHRVRIHLSNLGTQARTLQVQERVPVSELEEVRIRYDRDSSSFDEPPDADGFLRQTVTVAGGGTLKLELHYTLEHHKDVVGL